MKKRIALVLACVMALSAFLVACGNAANSGDTSTDTNTQTETPADTDDTDTEEAGDAEPVSFTFGWWGDEGRNESTQQIIDLYMDENPHVTITGTGQPWGGGDYQTAFQTRLAGGQEDDLMQINYNWLELYSPEGNTFLDLETVSDELGLDNWTSDFLDMMRTSGVLQGVPTGIGARIPFMNQTVYENAGITEFPTTWDELMDAGRTIQEQLGDGYFALSPLGNPSASYLVFSYLEQLTGKSFTDENNEFTYTVEELTEGFQFFLDLIEAGVVPAASFDSNPINASNANWVSGVYGGVSEWPSSIPQWITNIEEGNVIVPATPWTMDGAQLSGVMARPVMGFAISANTENPEEVAKFLNFMLTDERAVEIAAVDRGVPANTVGLEIFEGLELTPVQQIVVDANNIQEAQTITLMSPLFENATVRAIPETQIGLLQNGDTTAAEAAQVVFDQVPPAIAEQLAQ